MKTRRLLDMFCGEGLASHGYWQSGMFSEIVGVDINDMSSSYSFNFVQKDCMMLDYEFLMSFDFIHASPPCQAYSYITPIPGYHKRLVAGTRLMLAASGVPHVIENVQGSIKELMPNLTLDGHYVGLPMERRRYFYISSMIDTHQLIKKGYETIRIHGGKYKSRDELIYAFGLESLNEWQLKRLSRVGIEQGIPPKMTKFIADMCIGEKLLIG